jgi:EAL domain-containing protein (putative c-di-GMP-specific phosphodiesterase class I)
MGNCSNCSRANHIYDEGIIVVQSIEPMIHAFKARLACLKKSYDGNEIQVRFKYSSIEELLRVLQEIAKSLNHDTQSKLLCQIQTYSAKEDNVTMLIPLDQLLERMSNQEYFNIINGQNFRSFLQPVVSLESLAIFGYEFLLRPDKNSITFNPADLFSYSKRAGLQSLLDGQARLSSIKTSSELLPKGIKRFINFLPSSIYDPNHCLRSTFAAVEKYDVDPNDLIFEVVETEKISDIAHLKNIFDVYKKHGMRVALDDLGAGYATVEVLKELQPNFAKIDRSLIDHCDQSNDKQEQVKRIAEIANEYNITLLAEGIERLEEAQYCKTIGISLAQGYYFSPPRPQPIKDFELQKL